MGAPADRAGAPTRAGAPGRAPALGEGPRLRGQRFAVGLGEELLVRRAEQGREPARGRRPLAPAHPSAHAFLQLSMIVCGLNRARGAPDRKSVVEGKRVDLGGSRIIKKKKANKKRRYNVQ